VYFKTIGKKKGDLARKGNTLGSLLEKRGVRAKAREARKTNSNIPQRHSRSKIFKGGGKTLRKRDQGSFEGEKRRENCYKTKEGKGRETKNECFV